jgi:hypothetical protein
MATAVGGASELVWPESGPHDERGEGEQYEVDADHLGFLAAAGGSARSNGKAGARHPAPTMMAALSTSCSTVRPIRRRRASSRSRNDRGRSIQYGEWIKSEWIDRGDGHWVLRVPTGA